MNTNPIITIQDVSHSYLNVKALDCVNLDVQEGEILGLIGPDGAGKTTLFHVLTTLLVPDSGTAVVDGCDVVQDMRELRHRVGYMPGKFSLYQDLTVDENITFFASVFGSTVEENQHLIEGVYKMLRPFGNRRAGKLSGGMKQKLALCCALIHAPKVLFLDEPTTGVDPTSRKELWETLQYLKKVGVTIVVSTPYTDEARQCSRLVLMREGRIVQSGNPDEVLDSYLQTTGQVQVKSTSTKDEPVIQVRDLTKTFGNFTAVNRLNFEVSRGEIFGFLGANGAGKTTAMRMLSGLSVPTSGSGTVAGFDVKKEAEQVKRHIGYMSQRFSLYEDLKVWENIELFGGIYGLSEEEIKDKTEVVLEQLQFTSQRDTLVRDIPLGWKQKLAFAVSMIHDPEVVFLDEPTGGVDPQTRRQFWDLIYEAAAKGTTIFVTTHYMDEAAYCDRLSMMVDGQIKALDSPQALMTKMGVDSMEEVFRILARGATRGD